MVSYLVPVSPQEDILPFDERKGPASSSASRQWCQVFVKNRMKDSARLDHKSEGMHEWRS